MGRTPCSSIHVLKWPQFSRSPSIERRCWTRNSTIRGKKRVLIHSEKILLSLKSAGLKQRTDSNRLKVKHSLLAVWAVWRPDAISSRLALTSSPNERLEVGLDTIDCFCNTLSSIECENRSFFIVKPPASSHMKASITCLNNLFYRFLVTFIWHKMTCGMSERSITTFPWQHTCQTDIAKRK